MLYAALSLALFSPALFTGRALSPNDFLWYVTPWSASRPADITRASNLDLSDEVFQFEPWLAYARSRLPGPPLWNPYEGAGWPFIGNAQSAVFSPFSLPAYLLPYWFALGLIAALKTWVAAFGMFLFARLLRMRLAGALLAGAAYGLNLLLVAYVGFPQAGVWALLPWLLACTEVVLQRPGALTACGLIAATAAQYLCGHPEESFFAMFTVLAYVVLRLAPRRRANSMRDTRRTVGWLVGSLVGGAAFAALVIFPFVEVLRRRSTALRRRERPSPVCRSRIWSR